MESVEEEGRGGRIMWEGENRFRTEYLVAIALGAGGSIAKAERFFLLY